MGYLTVFIDHKSQSFRLLAAICTRMNNLLAEKEVPNELKKLDSVNHEHYLPFAKCIFVNSSKQNV